EVHLWRVVLPLLGPVGAALSHQDQGASQVHRRPSGCSGYHMATWKRQPIAVSGIHESPRDYVYWTCAHGASCSQQGQAPCRDQQPNGNIIIYWGYSKQTRKCAGGAHSADMFLLKLAEGREGRWMLTWIDPLGAKPWPRSGFSLAIALNHQTLRFAGVCDKEDESLEGSFHNTLYFQDTSKDCWLVGQLKRRKSEESPAVPTGRREYLKEIKEVVTEDGTVVTIKQVQLNDPSPRSTALRKWAAPERAKPLLQHHTGYEVGAALPQLGPA
ncbi:Kelch domain-containing protein 4, partial [Galemys pyrenaicus]